MTYSAREWPSVPRFKWFLGGLDRDHSLKTNLNFGSTVHISSIGSMLTLCTSLPCLMNSWLSTSIWTSQQHHTSKLRRRSGRSSAVESTAWLILKIQLTRLVKIRTFRLQSILTSLFSKSVFYWVACPKHSSTTCEFSPPNAPNKLRAHTQASHSVGKVS